MDICSIIPALSNVFLSYRIMGNFEAETDSIRCGRSPHLLAFNERRNMGELPRRKKLTLDQFVSLEYLPYIRGNLKSWATTERMLRCHVSPIFGHRKICEIRRMEVRAWQEAMLRDGFAIGTANRSLAALKALCSYAELRGYLPFGMSPCYKLAPIPQKRRTAYIAPPDKIAEMLAMLQQSDKPAANALRLIILTNARKNEILRARWEDIDWEERQLRSPRHVRGKLRFINLPEEAITLLKELRQKSAGEWIFPGRTLDRPITSIYQYWNGLRSRLGLPQMKMEDLRYNIAKT